MTGMDFGSEKAGQRWGATRILSGPPLAPSTAPWTQKNHLESKMVGFSRRRSRADSCRRTVAIWKRLGIIALLALALAVRVPGNAQTSEPAPPGAGTTAASLDRVIGEVTATNPAAGQITVKTDAGGTVTVILQEKTSYLRIPPGETNLAKAVKMPPAEIGVSDRIYARGRLAENQKSISAVTVIVISKAELAQKHAQEGADWQKRGVAGTIAALNRETQEMTLSLRSREGTKTAVIELAENAVFHRYAPDSVRFRDAKPSSFAELNVGDSLHVLGEKNADGTRIKAEAIVSGSFRNIAGIVNAVDATAGEIQITDLQTKKSLTVRINSDSMMRRMPPTMAAAGANRAQPGGGRAPAGTAGAEGRPGAPPRQPSGPNAPASEAAPRPSGSARGGSGGMDPEQMPKVSLAELKRGEAILVLCTVGAEPSRVAAIVLLAGVEPLLSAAPESQAQIGSLWNFFDISLP